MKSSLIVKIMLLGMVMLAGVFALAPAASAQDNGEGEAVAAASAQDNGEGEAVAAVTAAGGDVGIGGGLIAIGAGLAVGLAGMATGRAQASVGAGGTGAIAEKPELFTNVLILFAIPETIVILGFVIAFLLLGNI